MEWQKYKKKRILPKDWEFVKIKDIFETASGSTPNTSVKSYFEGGTIPWINSR